jgi:hypothetical protein
VTRLAAVLAALVVLLSGLAVRAATTGAVAKYGGVALYAVLVYTLVLIVAPRTVPVRAGVVALGACWAVELAQLTPYPAALSARSTLARLVLGSTFNAPDLAWYAVGIAVAGLAHALLTGRLARPTPRS